MQEQEKELFGSYEIKNWSFSARVYKIIAASAILNLLGIFVMAQTSVLTRKGCDSPFVSSICQVLDAVYVGSGLLGTDSEFVSKEYQKVELEDADITYIDVSSDTPPLKYPEGYFALANPEQFAATQDPTMLASNNFGNPTLGGFSTTATAPPASGGSSDLLAGKPNLPPVNKNPIAGNLPSSIYDTPKIPAYQKPSRNRFPYNITPKPTKIPDDSPKDLPKLGGEETATNKTDKPKTEKTPDVANQKPLESEKVADVEINKKPFEDLGDTLNDKLAKREIDLDKPFFVVLDGTLTEDGKFDPKKSKFGKTDGDKGMVDVAKLALEAVGESGILGYLKINGVEKVNFKLVQDENQIYAIITSDQKTPEKAQTTVSLLNTALQALAFGDNTGLKKLDENSKILVANSKVSSEGKSFVFKFTVPKAVGQDLINRSLKDRAEKKNNQPSNSGEANANSNGKIGK